MKILSISRAGREIAIARTTNAMMLIGRSPVCDVVLRAPGVAPVHFLLEWVGVGEIGNLDDGMWSVFDVSLSAGGPEQASALKASGEGLVLGDKPVRVGDYEFKWRVDRLMETPLEGRALREGFEQNLGAKPKPGHSYQLEVVTIREDSESVSHVYHADRPPGRKRKMSFPHLPQVKVEWGGGRQSDENAPVMIDVSMLGGAQVFERGVEVKRETGHSPSTVTLHPGDLMQVRWRLHQHYFRLVPSIQVPPAKRQLLTDPFYRYLAGGFAIALMLLLLAQRLDLHVIEMPKEPPRVAKIESKEIEIKEAPIPPPPPPSRPEPQEAQAAPTVAQADQSAKANNAPTNNKKAVASGLNSPAPAANVNSAGLLGALKTRKKPATITADRLVNNGILSQTVSGDKAQLVVQQPPAGVLGSKNTKGAELTGAFTTLNVKDSVSQGKSPASVVSDSGVHDGSEYSKSKEAEQEFAAEGGLDKESVRRTLAAYRKDIRTCYERALVAQPRIKGRVVYKWQIMPTGGVQWIDQASSTLDSLKLALCVKDVIKGIQFPQAANHQPTVVIYPFEFQTKN